MTFKHVKFEDSPTMRALEKVAHEKGLVKPEALEKRASAQTKKLDLSPSSDLMENILKLCSGLRSQGLVKEAAEIETNYLNYKQAQTLYETSKETGEDVINTAHPKGSHKLENVEGDEAVVETILDQYLKALDVVKKTPTGKLSSSAQIISEVKKSLGQFIVEPGKDGEKSTQTSAQKEMAAADADVQSALKMARGGGLYDITMNWALERGAVVTSVAHNPNMTPDSINSAKSAISAISRNLHPNMLHNILPEWINKGISTDALWNAIDQKLSSAQSHCDMAIQLLAEEMSKTSSTKSKRVQELLSLAQVDPEATKKGKAAMVQALELVDRGLGAFLGVFYGQTLEDEKSNIDKTREQIGRRIEEVKAASNDLFPNQLMNTVNLQILAAKKWVDSQRESHSSGTYKVDDQTWWRKFNYAASLVGQGQSMLWGAVAAINEGNLSGLQYHAAHISSDEVMNTINIQLSRPLSQLQSTLTGIDVNQIKSPQLKQFYPQLLEDLKAAITAAQNAAGSVMSASDPNLRVIHPSKIALLFKAPLDKDERGNTIFAGISDLNSLKQKCNYVVNIYKGYVDQISKSAGAEI